MHWSCRVFASLALALFFGLSSPIDRAYAQADEEKAQVIQRVVDLYKEERFLQRLLDAAVRAAPPEKQQDYQALVSKVDQDRIYTELTESVNELYTTEELEAYLEFASTDVGRSMLRKKTQMSEKLYEAIALELLDAALRAESAGEMVKQASMQSLEAQVSLRARKAASRIKTAIRLNPFHPDWYLWDLAWAQYYAQQYEDALASMKQMNKMPNLGRRTPAAIYVRLGRLEEAQAVIQKFLEKAPEYDLGKLRLNLKDKFRNPADAERNIENLRKAGLPE